MRTSDLHYDYPEYLVAKEPQDDFRTLYVETNEPIEIAKKQLLQYFRPGDVLVINDTKVLRRRVTSTNGLEILFLNEVASFNSSPGFQPQGFQRWSVLFPAREIKDGATFTLPGFQGGPLNNEPITARLIERGLPQVIEVSRPLDEAYFAEHAELALPPYIQKARGERRNRPEDINWYQSAWACQPGSFAAPTASLHFTSTDLEYLQACGVTIAPLTLHVGLGTFLPIKTTHLEEHVMHKEFAFLPTPTVRAILQAQQNEIRAHNKTRQRVWALGTTVTRALESWGNGLLQETVGGYVGETDLFIHAGYKFKVVEGLLTNFHQPGSTLLALVTAFAGYERVMNAYKWAIKNNFRLFSYGDLSVWKRL